MKYCLLFSFLFVFIVYFPHLIVPYIYFLQFWLLERSFNFFVMKILQSIYRESTTHYSLGKLKYFTRPFFFVVFSCKTRTTRHWLFQFLWSISEEWSCIDRDFKSSKNDFYAIYDAQNPYVNSMTISIPLVDFRGMVHTYLEPAFTTRRK